MAELSNAEKAQVLGRVPLFRGLPKALLGELAGAARFAPLKRRDELFHKGDPGDDLYVVVSGELKVLTTSAEGSDIMFNVLGPGDVIGEIALLAATSRTATVSGLSSCGLLAISRPDLLACLTRHPEAAIRLLEVLALRLKQVSELVEDTLFLNLPIRLAKKLLAFGDQYGEAHEAGIRVRLKLSQGEWGHLVGTSRESVNKQLGSWARDGWIVLESGHVVILRRDRLETLACGVL